MPLLSQFGVLQRKLAREKRRAEVAKIHNKMIAEKLQRNFIVGFELLFKNINLNCSLKIKMKPFKLIQLNVAD